MDLTWIAPAIVLLAGAAGVSELVRRLTRSVEELEGSQRRLGRLEHSLIPVRVETRRTRASIDRFPHR